MAVGWSLLGWTSLANDENIIARATLWSFGIGMFVPKRIPPLYRVVGATAFGAVGFCSGVAFNRHMRKV
jgi:hypothetical protein